MSFNGKIKTNAKHLAILICLGILVIAGGYVVYTTYLPPEDLHRNQLQNPAVLPSAQTTTPAVAVPGSTQNPESLCDNQSAASHIPVPVDTSVAIRDPMPGIRYSLNGSDSGRTIVLGKGDIVEINLQWIASRDPHWFIPVSGCGIEMLNEGYYGLVETPQPEKDEKSNHPS